MKDFIPYPEALAFKELGFNEPCFGLFAPPSKTVFLHHYGLLTAKEQILAPTYSQAFRWFREKYELYQIIHCPTKDVSVFTITGFDIPSTYSDVELKSYEEAELACLRKLIELVKNTDK